MTRWPPVDSHNVHPQANATARNMSEIADTLGDSAQARVKSPSRQRLGGQT
jgi:hypothetical protein